MVSTTFNRGFVHDGEFNFVQNSEKSQEELAEISSELRTKFSSYSDFFCSTIFPEYVTIYKHNLGYCGDRLMRLKKAGLEDKSNIKYPLLSSIHATYFSNTYDTETNIKAIPVTEASKEATEAAQRLVDWGFSIADADEHIKNMDYESSLIGPGFARAGFDDREWSTTYTKNGKEVPYKATRKNPRVDYIDAFKLYYDPAGVNFYTAEKFYVQRMTWLDVMTRYAPLLGDLKDNDEKKKKISEEGVCFEKYDFSRVKMIKGFEYNTMKHIINTNPLSAVGIKGNLDMQYTSDEVYRIDENDELYEVVEYWNPSNPKETFALFINGGLVSYGTSPYPFEGDPFVMTSFKSQPGTLFPKGIGQQIIPLQIGVDAFVNNWIDSINGLVNPSFVADKGIFGPDTPERLKLTPRKVYQRMPGKTIDPLTLVDPAATSTLLSGINLFISKAYEIIGLNSYTQGGAGGIERTKGGVSSRVQILKTALIPFFNNKNKALTQIGRKWIAMCRVYLPDNFKVRILEPDGAVKFEEIDINELLNEFDFSYNNQMKSLHRESRRDDIVLGMQYAQDPNTQRVLGDEFLKTLDIPVPDTEDKKKVIDEDFEIAQYQQEKTQELQGGVQGGGGQIPGAPIPQGGPQQVPATPQGPTQAIPEPGQELGLEQNPAGSIRNQEKALIN